MTKVKDSARQDAQFTDTERQRLEDCIKTSKQRHLVQSNRLYAFLSSVPNYQMEFEVGKAMQEAVNNGGCKQEQLSTPDNEDLTNNTDKTEIEKAVQRQRGEGSSEEKIRELEKALRLSEIEKEQLRGEKSKQHKRSERMRLQQEPIYKKPLDEQYKPYDRG
jgi:hypothetical protein